MRSFTNRSAMLAALGLLLGLIVPAVKANDQEKIADQSLELVETVISGIERNFSQIHTLHATCEYISRDSTVEKEEVKTVKSADGRSIFHIRMAPKRTAQWDFYFDGIKVRRDVVFSKTEEKGTWVFYNGAWTQYVPGIKTAWVRLLDQLPGMFPIDLRELGAPDVKLCVKEMLRQGRVLSAQTYSPAGGESVVQIETEGNGKYEWEFSSAVGFLPTVRISRYDDGSILQLVRFTYQSVLDGEAWFPLEKNTFFFDKGVTSDLTNDHWRQYITLRVNEIVMINAPIDEEIFILDLPNGTTVHDRVARESHIVGQPSPATIPLTSPHERNWRLIVATGLFFAIFVVVFLTRQNWNFVKKNS